MLISFAGLILGSALITLDGTATTIALPAIGHELSASMFRLQWISNAPLLVLAALLLPSGSIADRFGRARIIQTGLVVFVAGAIGAATWLARDGARRQLFPRELLNHAVVRAAGLASIALLGSIAAPDVSDAVTPDGFTRAMLICAAVVGSVGVLGGRRIRDEEPGGLSRAA